jgi:hypothetical protein
MEGALGPGYARTWAREHVITALGERTVQQALDAGEEPKRVWRTVWEVLRLPLRDR